jgi:hypothetical protein
MKRDHYAIYSEGRIGPLRLPNRLVRSATWDPAILHRRAMTDEVLAVYRALAAGGVGLIISGGLTVYRAGRGSRLAACVSCNSCLFDMYMHPGRPEPGVVRCVCRADKELHRQAQRWLAGWVRENAPALAKKPGAPTHDLASST